MTIPEAEEASLEEGTAFLPIKEGGFFTMGQLEIEGLIFLFLSREKNFVLTVFLLNEGYGG